MSVPIKPLLPYLAIAAALLAGWLYVSGLQSSVADLRDKNASLSSALTSETQARKADVAGLTTLAQGLTAAATDTKRDAAILQETINAANPTPSSPALAAFLAGLRTADQGGKQPATAGAGR